MLQHRKLHKAICTGMILLCTLGSLWAQGGKATLYGRVTDTAGQGVELVNIGVKGTATGTSTAADGSYSMQVPAGKQIRVVYSFIGYQDTVLSFVLRAGLEYRVDMRLAPDVQSLETVEIWEPHNPAENLVEIDAKLLDRIPNPTGSVESIILTDPGVYSSSELSSQYSVRGGSYDENLVYLNGIEVYRPFLISSGEQEGLSLLNPDMVGRLEFSAGGFAPRYGDKMASVLDITYKEPEDFGGTARMSFLGGSAHVEGTGRGGLLTYLAGMRYKTNQYLLNTLDVEGEYNPRFLDFQTYITYMLDEKLKVGVFGYLSDNRYDFIPVDRVTRTGTDQTTLELRVFFDGQEADRYTSYMGATRFDYAPADKHGLWFIFSAYHANEQENFDIAGAYQLNEVLLSQQESGGVRSDSLMNIGVGAYLEHARNKLFANVANMHVGGSHRLPGNKLEWGLKWQVEDLYYHLKEWELQDSTGYSLPYSDTQVLMASSTDAEISLLSNRLKSYVQNNNEFYSHGRKYKYQLIYGLRLSYWDFNDELLLSPRAMAAIIPRTWDKKMLFRLSGGYYYQPPFLREFISNSGEVNYDIRSQKSIHSVAGWEWSLKLWGRPFLLTAEAYYKHFKRLIPYEIDYVRIRYYSGQTARGYALGTELKLNGEFIPGTESWVSFSLMQTMEDVIGDSYTNGQGQTVEPGYIPRPTDRLLGVSAYLQDYLPIDTSLKFYMTGMFYSGLPYGPPGTERHRATLRMPPYQRVDIGFMYQLFPNLNLFGGQADGDKNFIEDAWLGLEVFNLWDHANVISYFWVRDIQNYQYAVPNYLTSRRLNLRLSISF